MTNFDMMLELELRGDMELFVEVDGVVRPIIRVEDDSQGTYIIVDSLATAQGEW